MRNVRVADVMGMARLVRTSDIAPDMVAEVEKELHWQMQK